MICPRCNEPYGEKTDIIGQGWCRKCRLPFPLDHRELKKYIAREEYHERDEARFKHKTVRKK